VFFYKGYCWGGQRRGKQERRRGLKRKEEGKEGEEEFEKEERSGEGREREKGLDGGEKASDVRFWGVVEEWS
jgi:hypothetical protein